MLVETCQGLFVDATNRLVGMGSLVLSVVIHSEGTLGAHEFWHLCMVVGRDLLTVEGRLDFTHILNYTR